MKKPLVLNVDDNEMSRSIRTQYLRAANLEVVEASSGMEALELAFGEQPDLVVLDVHLPDVNGGELCRRFKSDPRTEGTMVLQISASAVRFDDAVRGLDGGADGYLVEPVEPELLNAHVRSLLRLRESELKLRQSNDKLRQFVSLASHDLQEPLRAVLLFSEMLQRDAAASLSPEAAEHLERVREGGIRLQRLLEGLLTYVRSSAIESADSSPVSLQACVNEAIALCELQAREACASITTDPLPWVDGQENAITRVFQNLLSNAIKYRKSGQPVHIHISAQARSRDVVISVSDDGEGFSPAHADQVFGVFKRLHSRAIPGSGIGLAICKEIIERHGGSIWAESQPGAGATFRFTLPLGWANTVASGTA
jgi:signal transduction histidine kinase